MNCIKDFFQQWSSAIQGISVLVLVLVTWWYARKTNKMAVIMGQEYSLKTRPYLYINTTIDRNFDIALNPTTIQLKFKIENVGQIPISFIITSIMLNNTNIVPPQLKVYLFPNQVLYHTTPNLGGNPNIDNQGDGLEGHIRAEFWADEIPARRYFFYRKFRLAPNITTLVLEENFGPV